MIFINNIFIEFLYCYLFRIDGYTYIFSHYNLNECLEHNYEGFFNRKNIITTMVFIGLGGVRFKTAKRNRTIKKFGSTIGAARYPMFINPRNEKKRMLPRPVVNSRPGKIGSCIMTTNLWLRHLVHDIYQLCIKHLDDVNSEYSKTMKKHLISAQQIIHPTLRIYDTFFTYMYIVGQFNDTDGIVPLHLDVNDYINAVLYIVEDKVKGGISLQMNGSNLETMTSAFTIPFENGTLQIGHLYKVYHGASQWYGRRQVIHFSLKKNILQHFYDHGNHYYDQFVKRNFPSGHFVSV